MIFKQFNFMFSQKNCFNILRIIQWWNWPSGKRYWGWNVIVELILSAYQLALTCTTHPCQNDPHDNNHKICMESGFKPELVSQFQEKLVGFVYLKSWGIYYQHGWELTLQTLDHGKTNNYN